jgi:ankyrin repeat protein
MSKFLATLLLGLAANCPAQTPFEEANSLYAKIILKQISGNKPCVVGVPSDQDRASLTSILGQVAEPNLHDITGATPISYAVAANDIPEIIRLASLGYPLTAREIFGASLLHVAVHFNSIDSMKYLINNKVDPNTTDDANLTALMVAAYQGRMEAAQLLISSGASTSIKTESGKTALRYAIACKDQGMVDLLVAAGANVEEKERVMAAERNIRINE